MKITSTILLTASLVSTIGFAQTEPGSLHAILSPIATEYDDVGNDNNGVLSFYYPSAIQDEKLALADFTRALETTVSNRLGDTYLVAGKYKLVRLNGKSEKVDSISKCMFMTEGAYGEHVSKKVSKNLAHKVLRELSQAKTHSSVIYRVDGMYADLLNSECGILFHDLSSGDLAIFTSYLMD